jgi:hypothetical protein
MADSGEKVEVLVTPAELTASIILRRRRAMVIMETCALYSKRLVATMAYVAWPRLGIVE